MKENPSYHEWLQFTPEERGDTWLYDPLYKKPYESWDNYGREPTIRDCLQLIGQITISVIQHVLDIGSPSRHTDISQRHDVDV